MSTPVLTPPVQAGQHSDPAAGRIGAGVFNPASLWKALPNALRAMDPRAMWHNPVMFVVEVGATLSALLCFTDPSVFVLAVTLWLVEQVGIRRRARDGGHEAAVAVV